MDEAYLFYSEESSDDQLVRAVYAREVECAHYDANRRNYEAMLASDAFQKLPKEWPAALLPYKGVPGEQLAVTAPKEDLALISALQFRDQITVLLATNTIEQEKCQAIYKVLVEALPDEPRRQAAWKRVQVAMATRQAR